MTPQLRDVRRRAGALMESQRGKLIYQLFLLENARKTLERELINVTKKVFYSHLRVEITPSCQVASFTSSRLSFKMM